MTSVVRRWLTLGVRYGFCLVAIALLVQTVSWNDHVLLNDGHRTRVQLLEQRDNELVIERSGHTETIPLDKVVCDQLDGRPVPAVQLGIRNVALRLDVRLALWALLVFLPAWFIQSYRLVLMVAVQGVRLGYWDATKLTFAGNFFNFALPGTTGGDVVKAYYITHYTHLKTEVITTVFLDRAIGLFGMVLLAAGAIALTWDPAKYAHLIGVLGVIFGGLLVGCVLIFSRRLRHALRLPQLAARLPGGGQLLRIGRATVAMRQHKGRVLLALVLTLILQTFVMVSAGIMAWALGMHGSMAYYFIYVSIGFLIAAVPSTPQAVGVMEWAYVVFFTAGGLNTAAQAVAFALAVRLIQLLYALPGVLVPLCGAHLPNRRVLEELQAASEQAAAEAAGAEAASQVPAP